MKPLPALPKLTALAIAALLGTVTLGCVGQIDVNTTPGADTSPNNTNAPSTPSSTTPNNSSGSPSSGTSGGNTSQTTGGGGSTQTQGGTSINTNVQLPASRTFVCDDTAPLPHYPMRRLSQVQYHNTLRDILQVAAPGARGREIFAPISASIQGASFPKEHLITVHKGEAAQEKHGGFRRLDQRIIPEFIEISLEFATTIAQELTQTPSDLEALMGPCATDQVRGNDPQCVHDFIDRFGPRVLRHELDAETTSFYRSLHPSDQIRPSEIRDLLVVMLTAPEFLYFVEHGGGEVPGLGASQTHWLDPFEAASKLSYHFWQTMPDAELLTAAADGSLLQDDVWRAQVERVVSDPRTESSVRDFVHEWLWLDELPEMDGHVGKNLFTAFAGEDTPSASLKEKMQEEIADLAIYHTLVSTSDFSTFFLSNLNVTQDDELAALYKTTPWSGEGTPQDLPESERAGLITRAALLSTGAHYTRPILKGYFIRRALLCITPPPPPPGMLPDVTATEAETDREVVERLTEDPKTSCAGCHQTYINGLGFPTEGFDGLGRVKAEERLFAPDGRISLTKPVNTVSTPRIWASDNRQAQNASELGQMLAESKEVHACFIQHYWRFAFGRPEQENSRDGCGMEALRKRAVEGASLREIMMEVALRPEFRQRSFAQ